MKVTQHGVTLDKGPSSWEIVQQHNGYATISLGGQWWLHDAEDFKNATVYLRVLDENKGCIVLPWQPATTKGTQWNCDLKVPAGGPYRLDTCLRQMANQPLEWAARGDMVHHWGVGDVFVIAGQSNAVGYGREIVPDPPAMGVHVLRYNGRWDMASQPLGDASDSVGWVEAEGANPGYSPFLSFGKVLQETLGYPIGLVPTAHGGSPMLQWHPTTGVHYQGMLRTLQTLSHGVKGVLWYQGCSDVYREDLEHYPEEFSAMVLQLRKDLHSPTLPFFTMQLNRRLSEDEPHESWSYLREFQRQAEQTIDQLWVIPTSDFTLSDSVHNDSHSNILLGQRVAQTALQVLYGKEINALAPQIESVQQAEDWIILGFSRVVERLYAFELPVEKIPFRFIDKQGIIEIIKYEENENSLRFQVAGSVHKETLRASAGWGCSPNMLPVDTGTRLPIVSFHNIPHD